VLEAAPSVVPLTFRPVCVAVRPVPVNERPGTEPEPLPDAVATFVVWLSLDVAPVPVAIEPVPRSILELLDTPVPMGGAEFVAAVPNLLVTETAAELLAEPVPAMVPIPEAVPAVPNLLVTETAAELLAEPVPAMVPIPEAVPAVPSLLVTEPAAELLAEPVPAMVPILEAVPAGPLDVATEADPELEPVVGKIPVPIELLLRALPMVEDAAEPGFVPIKVPEFNPSVADEDAVAVRSDWALVASDVDAPVMTVDPLTKRSWLRSAETGWPSMETAAEPGRTVSVE